MFSDHFEVYSSVTADITQYIPLYLKPMLKTIMNHFYRRPILLNNFWILMLVLLSCSFLDLPRGPSTVGYCYQNYVSISASKTVIHILNSS